MSALRNVVRLEVPGHGDVVGSATLVPPGDYLLAFDTWSTHLMFGRQGKLALHFKIADFGEHFGKPLIRWCNVRGLQGRPRKEGGFKVGASSSVALEFARLAGGSNRLDRIPLSRYREHVLVGRVVTVSKARDQGPLPSCLQYSVISKLLRTEAQQEQLRPRPRPVPAPTQDPLGS